MKPRLRESSQPRGQRETTLASADAPFVIAVRVKPRSPVSTLENDGSGTWIARLRSPPVDGKANTELVGLVAQHFACAKSLVSVISGATARLKLVKVDRTDASSR